MLNPMHQLYGPYGEDKKCRDCAHITRKGKYFKCAKRGTGDNYKTDHRLSWDACGCWESS